MIELFRTDDGVTHPVDEAGDGVWVKLTAPSTEEIERVAAALKAVDPADIAAANDPEEKSRVEYEDSYSLILLDIPVPDERQGLVIYRTIPLGILVLDKNVITVCAEDTPILDPIHNTSGNRLSTRKRRQFLYLVLLRTALLYQRDLAKIDRLRSEFEEKIKSMTSEEDLIGLHELESTLVYFATSLSGNGSLLSRLHHSHRLHPSPSNEDVLEDAIIETQQAIEMAQVYGDIIHGARSLSSSLLDSRLNSVMQRLTSITLILSIPTVVSGLYGMNVGIEGMPFSQTPHAFAVICLITTFICLLLLLWLRKRRWL